MTRFIHHRSASTRRRGHHHRRGTRSQCGGARSPALATRGKGRRNVASQSRNRKNATIRQRSTTSIWSMRWVVLGLLFVSLLLSIAGSVLLFLVTRDGTVFVLISLATTIITSMQYILKFLFGR